MKKIFEAIFRQLLHGSAWCVNIIPFDMLRPTSKRTLYFTAVNPRAKQLEQETFRMILQAAKIYRGNTAVIINKNLNFELISAFNIS